MCDRGGDYAVHASKHNSLDWFVVVVGVVVAIAVGMVISVNMRVEAVGVSASLTARGERAGDDSEVE